MASIIPIGDKWRAQVRRKGHPTKTQTFKTKILAEKWARGIEAEIDAGAGGAKVSAKGRTISDLVADYITEVGEQKPFGRNKADVLTRLKHWLIDCPADGLTVERILKYIQKERRISGVTASIDLTYLKGVLKYARTVWRINVHPSIVDEARDILGYLGNVGRSNERDRRPTLDEVEKLCAWCDERSKTLTRALVYFILDSGFRPPSEITGLLWEDLNEADRTIVIRDRKDPRKKIGNNQTVPLLGRCFEIIQAQPGPRTGRIFTVNGKSWSSLFPRACEELGIHDLRLYDLRHEAISRLVESGKYSIPEVMLISGHKDPKQMMRYTQLRAKNLHR